ncbi:MAG: hypothetical protein ACXADW_23175 [Candidatus Hodarchaeales archaeon]|jgi:hypothetical protein
MSGVFEKGKLVRLEDFIVLANEGKDVHMDIKLREELVIRKVDAQEKVEKKDELHMFLLLADYTFKIDGEIHTVTKVYNFGSTLEKNDDEQFVDEALYDESLKDIANHRLTADYERLRKANIKFLPKYF